MTQRKYRAYAGIGSRETPPDVLTLMESTAKRLAEDRWTLRSGHAQGADQAFERGAGHRAEIYLPWPDFEKTTPITARTVVSTPSGEAHDVSAAAHPVWDQLKRSHQQLLARNAHQILGLYLKDPAAFVICWTPNDGLESGGTAQALRIAEGHGVPVFNLADPEDRTRVESL